MHALLHFVVGNLLVAVPLGFIAFFVQRGQRFPAVAHVLATLVGCAAWVPSEKHWQQRQRLFRYIQAQLLRIRLERISLPGVQARMLPESRTRRMRQSVGRLPPE